MAKKVYDWEKKQIRQCKLLRNKAKRAGINEAQRKQLDVACESSFNEFKGPKVVESLIKNKNLWKGAIMKRPANCFEGRPSSDLIDLRDLPDGHSNIDTLFVTAKEGKQKQLEDVIKEEWDADEVDPLTEKEATDRMGTSKPGKVIRVWWD